MNRRKQKNLLPSISSSQVLNFWWSFHEKMQLPDGNSNLQFYFSHVYTVPLIILWTPQQGWCFPECFCIRCAKKKKKVQEYFRVDFLYFVAIVVWVFGLHRKQIGWILKSTVFNLFFHFSWISWGSLNDCGNIACSDVGVWGINFLICTRIKPNKRDCLCCTFL